MADPQSSQRTGLLLGIGAYLSWGFLPLYFKAIAHVPSAEIVAHRIVWSLGFLAILVSLRGLWPGVRAALANRRAMTILTLTAFLIAANWLVFIYAVLSGHVIEASLGYYLNPLVNVLIGVLLLKERLSVLQIVATAIAATGVAVLAIGAGTGLWVSLTLAISFGFYGFFRKIAPADAVEGLTVETIILFPFALGWILWMQAQGTSGFLAFGAGTDILLVLGGAITAVPLLLFTAATRLLPYSLMGFLQYIAPSLQFLLAVAVFGEPLTPAHMACFAAIWTALALVTFDGIRAATRVRHA